MKKLLTGLFFCLFLNVFAQITVTLTTTNPIDPTSMIYNYMGINSFNPEDPQNQPIYLIASINGYYSNPIRLRVYIQWGTAEAFVWMDPDPNNLLPYNLTNRDLINNEPVGFEIDGDYDDFVNEIEDILLQTGKMPDGNYFLDLSVYDVDDLENPIAGDNVTITVISPLSIDLLTPGAPFGLSLVQIGTQYPEFLWISNFDEYNLYVYELDESITSAEDIELLEPHHQTVVYSNMYGYPPGAANSLSPGNIYAWQVTAETVTPITNQNVTMKSSFYVFQVMQGGSFPPIDPVVLQNLINQFMTTGAGVQELLSLLQNGYSIQTIWWQGQEITLEELMAILNSGQYTPVE